MKRGINLSKYQINFFTGGSIVRAEKKIPEGVGQLFEQKRVNSRERPRTIRKRGDLQWSAVVRRKGYPDVYKTFTRRADTQARAVDTEATMRKGLWLDRTEAEQTTLDTLLDRYKREITPQKRGYAQEQSKIDVLKKSHLASLMVAGITGASVALYRDERLKTVSPQTVIHEIHLLRHVFEISIKEWGLPLVSNPVALVSLPKLPRARDRRLEAGEEDRLLEAALKYGGCIRPAIIIALKNRHAPLLIPFSNPMVNLIRLIPCYKVRCFSLRRYCRTQVRHNFP